MMVHTATAHPPYASHYWPPPPAPSPHPFPPLQNFPQPLPPYAINTSHLPRHITAAILPPHSGLSHQPHSLSELYSAAYLDDLALH